MCPLNMHFCYGPCALIYASLSWSETEFLSKHVNIPSVRCDAARNASPLFSDAFETRIGDCRAWCSHEYHTNSTALALVRQVSLVDAAADGWRPPIVEIVMQLPVSSPKFQLLQEEGVVLQGQGVEDVELGL